jgi:hypothetical protein
MHEQIPFVFQDPVQTAVQAILFGAPEIHPQQYITSMALIEPLPVQAKSAAHPSFCFPKSI